MNTNTANRLELHELAAFVKVAKTGSFTQAGELLGASKGQVSKSVTLLESKLGVRLLERSTRSVCVTERGRDFLDRAVLILQTVEDTQEELRDSSSGKPQGTLKLTCGACFGATVVGTWIGQYLQLNPEVSVEAHYSDGAVDLIRDGFDLAIRLGQLSDSTLSARRLGSLEYGLYASPDYLARHGPITHPRDLLGLNNLAFSLGSQKDGITMTLDEEQVHVPSSGRLRINSRLGLLEASKQSLGVVCLPKIIARPAIEAGSIQSVLPDWKPESTPIYAVFPSRNFLPPKVRYFIEHAILMHGYKTSIGDA